jgi:predicted DNA-binding transcriptional regulator AlpA
MDDHDLDTLLTSREAAALLRLSERTLERHRLSGSGPKFVRLGRRVFYRRDALGAWIAECTCRSTSEADARAGRYGELASPSASMSAGMLE